MKGFVVNKIYEVTGNLRKKIVGGQSCPGYINIRMYAPPSQSHVRSVSDVDLES